MTHTITPDGRGRLLLPRDAREALGLEERQEVAVELRGDGSVVLRDPVKVRASAVKALRGSARDTAGSVNDLLAERRHEAELEDRKDERLGGSA